jgi:hypothetical protein
MDTNEYVREREMSPSWETASRSAAQQPEGSLSYSQEPSTGPYPESDESTPHNAILFS